MCVALLEVLAFDLPVDASLAPDERRSCVCVWFAALAEGSCTVKAVRQLDAHLSHLTFLTDDVSLR